MSVHVLYLSPHDHLGRDEKPSLGKLPVLFTHRKIANSTLALANLALKYDKLLGSSISQWWCAWRNWQFRSGTRNDPQGRLSSGPATDRPIYLIGPCKVTPAFQDIKSELSRAKADIAVNRWTDSRASQRIPAGAIANVACQGWSAGLHVIPGYKMPRDVDWLKEFPPALQSSSSLYVNECSPPASTAQAAHWPSTSKLQGLSNISRNSFGKCLSLVYSCIPRKVTHSRNVELPKAVWRTLFELQHEVHEVHEVTIPIIQVHQGA